MDGPSKKQSNTLSEGLIFMKSSDFFFVWLALMFETH